MRPRDRPYVVRLSACSLLDANQMFLGPLVLAERISIRARKVQHVLGEIAEDEIGRDRCDLVQPRLAELALDVVLLGEAESAVGLQAHVARLPRGFRRELLGHVRFRPAGLALLVELRGALDHQRRGFGRHIGAGDRKLHALVLADRPAEDLPLVCVGGRLGDEPPRVADTLGADQNVLCVHAVEDVAEALALLADEVLGGDLEVLEEDFGGRVVDHGADRPDRQALSQRRLHFDDEHREAVGLLLRLLARRGAREQQHQVGVLGARSPDLLAVHHVAVTLLHRGGAYRRGVRAGRGLGDAEGLQPQLALRDLRQILFLLRLAAVPQHRAHGVHLRVAGGAVRAALLDFLENRGGRGELQARAAVLLGDEAGEPARLGERAHELGGVAPLAVGLAPVFHGEARAKLRHGIADFAQIVLADRHFLPRMTGYYTVDVIPVPPAHAPRSRLHRACALPRPRSVARARRAHLREAARRFRRGRSEDRNAAQPRGRHHGRPARRSGFPEPAPQQALDHAQPEGEGRRGDLHEAREDRRRGRRELPPGREVSPRHRLRVAREGQPAHHPREHFGFWPGRPLRQPAGLRPDRAGHGRVYVNYRAPWTRTCTRRHRDRGHLGGPLRRARDYDGPP